ncbi:hypothetical protein A3F37_04430 [Candidatus Saccharibacteria bacterium RIFCSPHIGHO2_12_FULL_41_12]|nr:MAG: hypothetical protein A3F37_04430 [Candidatus Saccharibacteria bacterium RIFCSPHIGHO2_12_FULL_41_12]
MYRDANLVIPPAEALGGVKSPQETEGVFLPKQWLFNHGIAAVSEVKEIHRSPHRGVIDSRIITMEDGSVYETREGKPFLRSLKLPQTSLETTAYATRMDGFNLHRLIKKLEMGLSTVSVSRPLKWEGELSQARTAHNVLTIGRYMVSRNDLLDPINVQPRGISRGGMNALVATALAQQRPEQYGLNPFYFSATAPCYPRPIELKLKDVVKMSLYEAASLTYHLAQMPIKALSHYPNSIDYDLRFLVPEAVSLVNGDAGKARNYMSKDPRATRGYILGFYDDVMGMGETWQKDFTNFDGVSVEITNNKLLRIFNGHLRVVSPSDLSSAMERQLRLAEEYKTHGGNLDAIDYNYVSLGI